MGHSWRGAAPPRFSLLVTTAPRRMGLQSYFQSCPIGKKVRWALEPTSPSWAGGFPSHALVSSLLSEVEIEGNRFSHNALSLTLVGTKPKTHFWRKLLSVSQ